jgi:excinuclease ABC subunit B
MTVPQTVGMYKNDRTRKEILGSTSGSGCPPRWTTGRSLSRSSRPHLNQVIYMSATPAAYELQRAEQIAEQLIRRRHPRTRDHGPSTEGQIDDLMDRIKQRVDRASACW